MYHFFIEAEQVNHQQITLKGTDVNHIKNVLRMKLQERLAVTDEDGVEYLCEIEAFDRDTILLTIQDRRELSHELPAQITLFQGLPKSDKFETIIQKAVELGAFEIVPMQTRRCVVRLDAKKQETKGKRWNAIAESAAKQSKRTIIPRVGEMLTFQQAVERADEFDVVSIPYEHAEGMKATKEMLHQIQPGSRVAFYIGPEGGFEETEIELALKHQIQPVSLGKRVLRTETAGMALLSMMMLQLECAFEEKQDGED